MVVPERFLQRMECAVAAQPFDGGHRRPVDLGSQARARFHCDTVEQHGARAALTGVAADLRTGQPGELADEMNEEGSRLNVALEGATVDRQTDRNCHSNLRIADESVEGWRL